MTVLPSCGLCSCNLLAETNYFNLGAVLLSYLFFDLQKESSPGIEPRTVFRDCGHCFCYLLFEANNFDLGAIFLSYLGSELQELLSPGIELRIHSRSFNPPIFSFLSQVKSIPSFVQIGLYLLEL
jgi:hypothetical protein